MRTHNRDAQLAQHPIRTLSFACLPFSTLSSAKRATLSSFALYLNSLDEFPEHIGILNHRVSEGATWPGFLIIVVLGTFMMLIPTHTTYTRAIKKLRPDSRETEEIKKCCHITIHLVGCFLSAIYKAAVRSTSFTALLMQPFTAEIAKTKFPYLYVYLALSIPFFVGSFVSEFALNAGYIRSIEKMFKRLFQPINSCLSSHCLLHFVSWAIRHALTLPHNIANTALYFNAATKFLKSVDILDHRLGSGSWWEFLVLAVPIIGSIGMFLITQYAYAKKIQSLVTQPNQTNQKKWHAVHIDFHAIHVAAYKTVINSLSLISLSYSIMKRLTPGAGAEAQIWALRMVLGCALAIACSRGTFLSQFSILKFDRPTKDSFFAHSLCKVLRLKAEPTDAASDTNRDDDPGQEEEDPLLSRVEVDRNYGIQSL